MTGDANSNPFQLKNSGLDPAPPTAKRKRNLPGTPDPEAEVIALSPRTLLATNRFLCEICGKGFQRDQNLQLHRRGHNLPWKLRQRSSKEPRKRVYVCPEKTCVHHNPARALGDLTGVKKHFCRKHGEKKWKCEKCSKRYAVQSDWKAHSKTCGTREYRCDCGTLFSRRDSFITHRAFCDALAEETARVSATSNMGGIRLIGNNVNYHLSTGLVRSNLMQHFNSNKKPHSMLSTEVKQGLSPCWDSHHSTDHLSNSNNLATMNPLRPVVNTSTSVGDFYGSCSKMLQHGSQLSWICGNKYSNTEDALSSPLPITSSKEITENSQPLLGSIPSLFSTQYTHPAPIPDLSATALLQKAAHIGMTSSSTSFMGNNLEEGSKFGGLYTSCYHPNTNLDTILSNLTASDSYDHEGETRDFLGIGGPVGVQTLCQASMNGWI